MSLSPELQASADEIRRNKSLVKSLQAERDLWKSKAMDAQGQLDVIAGKREMSDEDRAELKRQAAELDALNDELEGAAQDNTAQPVGGATDGAAPAAPVTPKVEPEPIPTDAEAARPDPMPGTARGDGAPLMPNLAFNPDPTGGKGAGDAGQPNQPTAVETPGGFVVSGGGSTQRAPGSDPASPSSTLVAPPEAVAEAESKAADEAAQKAAAEPVAAVAPATDDFSNEPAKNPS